MSRSASARTFFNPTPFARWELVVMRMLFALVIWDSIPEAMNAAGVPQPTGLALFFPDMVIGFGKFFGAVWFKSAVAVLLSVYALGSAAVITTPLLLMVTVFAGTLTNSQGAITHHSQIVSLVLLAQSGCLIYDLIRHRRWRTGLLGQPVDREIHVAYVTQQAVVAGYMVSAYTKLKESGLDWFVNAARFPIQLKKNTRMAYFNELKEHGSDSSFLTDLPARTEALLMASPNLCRVIIGSGLVLEIAVVLALAGRVWAFFFGVAFVLFHSTISKIMGLDFDFNIYILSIFFILPGISASVVRWSRATTKRSK
ncbi:MAG: hypothetical protein O3C21_00600 [Verrucomicrobia bacterium]|nr:hypothetical protein [Verrucomicrobiota bacterium]